MNLATVIAVIVLAAVIFLAGRYIYREKKRGTKCIGCPYAGSCQKRGAPHPKAK
ncbi:MAG: FeoB-associated Cys-rich membrane protein [Oscillospiraceae bacterium]|nr:FeoB-associated Cys-rich membrane protein [Oscillospiraceae bacterium]